MSDYLGKDTFKLGFGLMRLPKNEDGSISIEKTSKMIDEFIEAGGTYFDTAYIYDGGESEKATKLALVDRYPRDSFTLATKLNTHIPDGDSEEKAKQQFYTSLDRTGATYFDYYLLHALDEKNTIHYDEFHIWDFVKELKEKGLIKHYGFSYHGGPEFLDELLIKHPDVEFVQLQINYADWNHPTIKSRENYEVVRKHNKPIIIMEPVKGGTLANPLDKIQDLFKSYNKDLSCSSWAIRFAASLDGVITVLSGMSNLEQMQDNLSYMRDFKPLNKQEEQIILQARFILETVESIGCTACKYCVDGCPMNISIPDIFKCRNEQLIYNSIDKAKQRYQRLTKEKGKASDCIECGQCEGVCPQQLPIIELLKEAFLFSEDASKKEDLIAKIVE